MPKNLYFPVFYRDWRAICGAVTPEQGWRLFLACLDYSENGTEVDDSDPVICAFFKLISGGIDRSKEASDARSIKNRYARYCGICKEQHISPLPFEQWLTNDDDCKNLSTHSNKTDNHNRNHNQKSESNAKSNKTADKPPSAPRFTPPTVEEVTAYCLERGNQVDPQRFVDFYSANGWVQGKGKPIRDWKACVRTWERDTPVRTSNAPSKKQYNYDYEGDDTL